MTTFQTKRLPLERDVVAVDGSEVRTLLTLRAGSMAHFQLAAGETTTAVRHRTVEEIWYVISGRGEMWRHGGHDETIVDLEPGTCLTIEKGTRFQFRATEALSAVAVTMPPWPGDGEAEVVEGRWAPTVPR